MNVNCILAADSNNIIGIGNNLPWKIREEMQHFKRITLGNTLVMGKTTFLEIVKNWPLNIPFLEQRQIIVLTTNYGLCRALLSKTINEKIINNQELIDETKPLPFLNCFENQIFIHQITPSLLPVYNFELIKNEFKINKCQGELYIAGGNVIYKDYLKFCNHLHFSIIKKNVRADNGLVRLYPEFEYDMNLFNVLVKETDFKDFTYKHISKIEQ